MPFPRGSGLVTRCPTQLILSKSPPGSAWTAEASVNWNRPEQPPGGGRVSSIEELNRVINTLTDALTDGSPNGL